MKTTLITFLGRTPKVQGSYRKTRYDFGDGTRQQELAFFGWALQERLRADRFVVFGTRGSMWDHLFEGDLDLGGTAEAIREELIGAVEEKAVEQAMLDELADPLSEHLGCDVRLRLIPYGLNEEEQVAMLQHLADEVPEGAVLHLDITHAFRHLPMISLLAALYLRVTQKVKVEKIWYGAYDEDTGKAPVYDLSGLLRMTEWLQAVAAFDKDGDYSVFVPLLERAGAGAELVGALRRAAYFENILNVGSATGELRKALDRMESETVAAPEARLLLSAIRRRLDWVVEKKQFEKQVELARQSLSRNDYLRAVLYAYEAVITRLCQLANVSVTDFDGRENVRQAYERALRPDSEERRAYRLLKDLRNQVAHGSRGSRGEVQKILLEEGSMRSELERLVNVIGDGHLPEAATAEGLRL